MRLFAAIEPSFTFREALVDLQGRLRAAGVQGRYMDAAGMHMTLAFIGEWPDAVTACLPPLEAPFDIALSHVGVFPRAKVLWAGVKPSPELNELAGRVRRKLTEAGIPFDPKPFNPHITLIRKPVLPGGAPPKICVPAAAMTVRQICLYQSANGVYTVIGRTGSVPPEQAAAETGGSMTEYQRLWAQARDRLGEALEAAGYPAEIADMMAKHLGAPKAIDRMTDYVRHGYARNMEMLADEMLAIRADADAWREKKESREAQAGYNAYLYSRRMENDEDE